VSVKARERNARVSISITLAFANTSSAQGEKRAK